MIEVSTKVDWPVYAGLGLLGAYLIWVLVAPDKAWRLERVFVAWQYRDGDRIELSSAGRGWVRFTAVAGMAILVFGVGLTFEWSAAAHVREELDSAFGHEDLSVDADLVLYVADRFFPTHLVVSEQRDRVTVSLYGKQLLSTRGVCLRAALRRGG